MSINLSELHNLPIEEKLRIVEALWDDIGASDDRLYCSRGNGTKPGGVVLS